MATGLEKQLHTAGGEFTRNGVGRQRGDGGISPWKQASWGVDMQVKDGIWADDSLFLT